jgi:hypothetical protein
VSRAHPTADGRRSVAGSKLHRPPSKQELEKEAGRHISARQLQAQSLKALARFTGVPLAILAQDDSSPMVGASVSAPDLLEQLEAYVQHRIALALGSKDASEQSS